MSHLDLLTLSLKNVVRSGKRTGLCILAICIGIASVSAVLSLGTAAGKTVQKELDRIGIEGIVFYPKSGISVPKEAVQAIQEAHEVSAAMQLAITSGNISLRNVNSNAGILGIDETLPKIFHLEVLHGTLPNEHQIRTGQKIAIIDEELAQKAYQRTNVIGKTLTVAVNGISEQFEVCTVIRSQSASLSAVIGSRLPHLVYLPHTVLSEMSGSIIPNKMIVTLAENDLSALDRIQKTLQRKVDKTFEYENLNQYLDSFQMITNVISLAISGIAGISVIVGGIGVMNSMVSSVEGRTQEIGIYRALGAKKRWIIQTFTVEAIILCLVGGICGILLSRGSIFIVQKALHIQISFHWNVVIISLALAVACGILFGIIPAIGAAKLDPIQAIRSE